MRRQRISRIAATAILATVSSASAAMGSNWKTFDYFISAPQVSATSQLLRSPDNPDLFLAVSTREASTLYLDPQGDMRLNGQFDLYRGHALFTDFGLRVTGYHNRSLCRICWQRCELDATSDSYQLESELGNAFVEPVSSIAIGTYSITASEAGRLIYFRGDDLRAGGERSPTVRNGTLIRRGDDVGVVSTESDLLDWISFGGPSPRSLNVNQLGARLDKVADYADHLYGLGQSEIVILDVNRNESTVLGRVVLGQPFQNIAAGANRLAVWNDRGGQFDVFDITDPLVPARIGMWTTEVGRYDTNHAMFVSKSRLVFGGRSMLVLDLDKPRIPSTITNVDNVMAYESFDDTVYVLRHDGLEVYTIDGIDVTWLRSIPLRDADGAQLYRDGSRMVTCQSSWAYFFDLTVPEVPKLEATGGVFCDDFAIDHELAIGSRGFQIRIFDLTDMSAPSSTATLSGTRPVEIAGRFAFATRSGADPAFVVHDLDDPANPIPVATISLDVEPIDYFVHEFRLFVVDDDGLTAFDIHFPASPMRLGHVDIDGIQSIEAIRDGVAYCLTGGGVVAVDIADSREMTEAGRVVSETVPIGLVLTRDQVVFGSTLEMVELHDRSADVVTVEHFEAEQLGNAIEIQWQVTGNAKIELRAGNEGAERTLLYAVSAGGSTEVRPTQEGVQQFSLHLIDDSGRSTSLGHTAVNYVNPIAGPDRLVAVRLVSDGSERPLTVNLSTAGLVDIDVFDVAGRRVARAFRGTLPAGNSTLSWNPIASHLGAGLYWARLRAHGFTYTERIVVAP